MTWIYLAAAIFGGSFLIPMVLGGLADMDTDFEADADFDADFEADFDVDADVDSGDAGHGHQIPDGIGQGIGAADAIVGSLLSFRSVVFFATFFGVTGLLLGFLGYNFLLTLITALVLGAISAVANSAVFGLLKASESSSQVSERSFVGRQGVVTVPIADGRRGRIRVDMGGQPQYLVASGYTDDDHFDVGHPVAVLQLENGIALVTSLKKELQDLDQELAAGAGQLPEAESLPDLDLDTDPEVADEIDRQRPAEGT